MSPGPDDPRLLRSLIRWQRGGGVLLLALVLAFPIYRWVESGRRDEALVARQAALIAAGRDLWAQNCASCHGVSGEGVDAPALNAREFLESVTDEQVHHITAAGIPGTEMPAWWNEFGGPLTDEQIRALVAFIRSWEDSAPSRPDWREPGGEEATPPPEEHQEEMEEPHGAPAIRATHEGCGPEEIRVQAGRRVALRFVNESEESVSLDLAALGQHVHADPGEAVSIRITPTQEGEYPFECLGAAHGTLLGAGVIVAE